MILSDLPGLRTQFGNAGETDWKLEKRLGQRTKEGEILPYGIKELTKNFKIKF